MDTLVVFEENVAHTIVPIHLNTPRLIADQAGNTVWRNDNTEPFGASVSNGDPNSTGIVFEFNLRFPGQYFERETNLKYNYFRDYDPGTGRYVQSDPIGLRGGINTYGYVSGSPLRFSDPAGLVKWSGEVYSFGASAALGGSLFWFDLKSECVNNKYAYIHVFASAIMAGVGIRANGSASGVDFEDGLSTIDPSGFTGDFKVSQAGIGLILTRGYNIYKIGSNTSYMNVLDPSQKGLKRIEPQPGIGIDVGIGSGWGHSAVTSVDIKDCGCKDPK